MKKLMAIRLLPAEVWQCQLQRAERQRRQMFSRSVPTWKYLLSFWVKNARPRPASEGLHIVSGVLRRTADYTKSSMPKKAKGGSKDKSKGGKEKVGKPEEAIKPQITVSDALQRDAYHAGCLC